MNEHNCETDGHMKASYVLTTYPATYVCYLCGHRWQEPSEVEAAKEQGPWKIGVKNIITNAQWIANVIATKKES